MNPGSVMVTALALGALLAASAGALAADLEVRVTGLRSDSGSVHLALYDRPETFPEHEGMRAEAQAAIVGGTARFAFADLPAGAYAIAAYHDENGNGAFDQAVFGIPLEGYGFSNDARALLSAPTFEAAAFRVDPPGTRIAFGMVY